jgi:hypothetical protein
MCGTAVHLGAGMLASVITARILGAAHFGGCPSSVRRF